MESTAHASGYGWSTTRRRSAIAHATLYLGALAVLGIGVVHIQQYYGADYSTVPTIGTLFFLNFVSAVVITAGLVAPLGRIVIRAGFAAAGIGLGVLSLVSLFISESSSGLFGFQEHGYGTPITLAIVAEAASVVLLVVYLAANGKALRDLRTGSR